MKDPNGVDFRMKDRVIVRNNVSCYAWGPGKHSSKLQLQHNPRKFSLPCLVAGIRNWKGFCGVHK